MRNRRHQRRQSQKARMEKGEWRMEKGKRASQALTQLGGQGQGLVFRVLFQISTADKTHVFIPCVCPVLVSVLLRFSRGERSL